MILLGMFLAMLMCTWVLMWAVLVVGLMTRAALRDPEVYCVRLGYLKRLTDIAMWSGFLSALLSVPLFFDGMSVGDPVVIAVALALFLIDLRLDAQLGNARSLLIVHRIDNGTFRSDRVA